MAVNVDDKRTDSVIVNIKSDPELNDVDLLRMIQRQTLKYFYDFAHLVSVWSTTEAMGIII